MKKVISFVALASIALGLAAAAPQLLEALTWALAQISDDLDPDHQESLESALGLVMRFEEAR